MSEMKLRATRAVLCAAGPLVLGPAPGRARLRMTNGYAGVL